jgi:hypothetical protein
MTLDGPSYEHDLTDTIETTIVNLCSRINEEADADEAQQFARAANELAEALATLSEGDVSDQLDRIEAAVNAQAGHPAH